MDGKPTSLSQHTFHGNMAAMGLGDVFDNGQAETGAAQLAAARLVHPVESLKQPGQVLLGNSAALVFDADDHLGIIPFDVQVNSAVRVTVFNGIVQQVDNGLFE